MTTERERDKNGHLKAGIRLPGWDYCKPWFYMITLVVKRRCPILGEIVEGKHHLGSRAAQVASRRSHPKLQNRLYQGQHRLAAFPMIGI